MKVINKTHYDTQKLRQNFYACLKQVRKQDGYWFGNREKFIIKHLVVRVSYSRGVYASGRAWVNNILMKLFLPHDQSKLTDSRLADLFIHELGHNIDKRSSKGHFHIKGDTIERFYQDWITKNFPVEPKQFPNGEVI